MRRRSAAIGLSVLRNTIGFGWHPGSGQLWGVDHGSDARGDDQPPEELNLLFQGGNYGWPYGSLLVSDDAKGVIYRISWAGR